MLKLFRLITNGLAPLTLLGAIVAYLHPPLFVWLKPWLGWLIAITMLALGTVLHPEELGDTLSRPRRLGAGLLTQYTVMPLLGFLVARFAGLPDAIAVGFIIVACAPGAMASNVIVYLAGGALGFSIALTTLATLLSPFRSLSSKSLTPLMMNCATSVGVLHLVCATMSTTVSSLS